MIARIASSIFLAALCCAALPRAPETPSQGRDYVSTPGIPAVSVKAGGSVPVEFPFDVAQGFHVNSHQPTSQELIPTQIAFNAPSDLVISAVQYPVGTLMAFPFDPSTKLNVYGGRFVIRAKVLAPAKVGVGAHTIHGELSYQACDNRACYPPKKLPVEFVVNVSKGSHSARPNRQSPHIH